MSPTRPFVYSSNLPTLMTDPSGLFSCDYCLEWYSECMLDIQLRTYPRCQAHCAYAAGVPGGIAAVIACGAAGVSRHPILIAICLGLTISDTVGLMLCMANCEAERDVLTCSCEDAYQWCLCHCK